MSSISNTCESSVESFISCQTRIDLSWRSNTPWIVAMCGDCKEEYDDFHTKCTPSELHSPWLHNVDKACYAENGVYCADPNLKIDYEACNDKCAIYMSGVKMQMEPEMESPLLAVYQKCAAKGPSDPGNYIVTPAGWGSGEQGNEGDQKEGNTDEQHASDPNHKSHTETAKEQASKSRQHYPENTEESHEPDHHKEEDTQHRNQTSNSTNTTNSDPSQQQANARHVPDRFKCVKQIQ
eukprot:NODE_89_length_21781_cov_0.895836.p10 type:complete len:237 gc:universal NODE_89_length_21781_cov_0.895836:7524-6814(-)